MLTLGRRLRRRQAGTPSVWWDVSGKTRIDKAIRRCAQDGWKE